MSYRIETPLNTFERQISYGKRRVRLSLAVALALVLHLLLLWLMPDLPKLIIDTFNRDTGLLVTIEKREEPEVFQQTLEKPVPDLEVSERVLSPSLAAASKEPGDQNAVTDDLPELNDVADDNQSSDQTDTRSTDAARPVIRFDHATVKLFVEQDAKRFEGRYPEQLAQFARSFRSSRSVTRRAQLDSFRNRMGDLTVRASSSEGDICFKQEADQGTDDFQTKTVMFFRCGEKPKKFELRPEDG